MKSMLPRRRRALALVLLVLPLAGAVAWAADKMKVVEKEAVIRKDKKTYSAKVAVVTEGEEVTVVEKDEPWIKVEYKGQEGWLNESSVTDDLNVILSSDKAASGVKASESSAAGRGFTPEVEAEYRKGHPDLKASFDFLDRIEAEWVWSEDKIVAFLKAGKLIDAGGGK
jgi:hypothetical protein